MPPCADALTAAMVLRTAELSRNRNFALHATAAGASARRRARCVRGLVAQITGTFGPAHRVSLEQQADEVKLRYVLARLSLTREARLSPIDLSILRVALARAGVRLLPAALVARDDDRARVEALLAQL